MKLPSSFHGSGRIARIRCRDSLEHTLETTRSLRDFKYCTGIEVTFIPPQQDDKKNMQVVDSVIEVLQTNSHITSLKLSHHGRGDREAQAYLMEALASGASQYYLKHLYIGGSCHEEYCTPLARYLTGNEHLETLKLTLPNSETDNSLQVASALTRSNVTSLHLTVMGSISPEMGAMLSQCTSISTLCLNIMSSSSSRRGEAFQNMKLLPNLRHFCLNVEHMTASLVDVVSAFVRQHALETVSIETIFYSQLADEWAGLSSALCGVKHVEFHAMAQNGWSGPGIPATLVQHLSPDVESLTLDYSRCSPEFASAILSSSRRVLPEQLKSLVVIMVDTNMLPGWVEPSFLKLLETSHSMTHAELKSSSGATLSLSQRFQDQVAYYCSWNKVQSTKLLLHDKDGVWPHALLAVAGSSAIYRVLREKPDLIVSRNTQ